MAAVPFGFSVGDFLAGVELIHKAAKALRSVSGATEQYQQTLLDLSLIESVLRRVQGLTPATASDETIRTVQLCSLACHVPLDRFLNKIRKLERQLNFDLHPHTTDTLGIKKGSHKLQWAIILEQDVAKLKASISPGIDIINTLLQVESLERGASTQEGLQRILDQSGSIFSALDKVTTVLQSNATTETHTKDLLPILAHLKHQASYASTAQQVHSLNAALIDVSEKVNQNASRDQVNDLAVLAERIRADRHHDNSALSTFIGHGMQELAEFKEIAEASKCMLVTLVNQLPNAATSHGTALLPHNITNQRQPSLEAIASHSSDWGSILQHLLEALRHALNAILLCLLCAKPFLQACFRSINAISRAPRVLLDSNITFVDALNREFSLQYQQFRYWPVVSAWLQCQFQDCPGALRISRGRFAIFKDMRLTGKGVMIPFGDWERTVRPGQRVLMSMYVSHQNLAQGHWPLRNACPSCGYLDAHLHRTSVWIKRAKCEKLFLLHDLEAAGGSSTQSAPASQQLSSCDEPDVFDRKEISAFSRVHDLQQHSSPQQHSPPRQLSPTWRFSSHRKSRADDMDYPFRYAEGPTSRRYVMMPNPIEGRSPPSVTRPKPKVHNSGGPMPKEDVSTSVMNPYGTR